jgi:hypothetical protein
MRPGAALPNAPAGVSAGSRRNPRRLRLLVGVLLLFLACACAQRAAASGHETLTLASGAARIYYEPGDLRVAKRVAEICEDEIPRLSEQLGITEVTPVVIEIADDITPYRRRSGNDLPRWGVAFALMGQQRIIVDVKRAARALNSLEKVIPHELSHLYVAQRVGNVRLPIWFLEGLAQWQAREWSLIDSWQLMNVVWGNKAPTLWQLIERYPRGEERARAAYRVSHAAFVYRFGSLAHELPLFLDTVARHGDFERAFEDYWGEETTVFYARFHKDLEAKYRSRLLLFQPAPLFSLVAALFLFVILRYSLRKRRKLKDLERLESGFPLDDDQS